MGRIAEIAGLLLGLLYLWLEYRADWKLWIVSIIMPINSLYVYWNAGLYADFTIDIYYVLIAVYGYYVWRHGGHKGTERPIVRTPRMAWPLLFAASVLLWVGIAQTLIHFTPSTVPWWDALNTALSIVAMWMLARKWVEQWLVWLVVDAVSAALYVRKGIPFYAVLYTIYVPIAWLGYLRWLRKMKTAPEDEALKNAE